ncbi:MAG: hypothetical protein WCJ95_18715 [Mariniphaga sp.]
MANFRMICLQINIPGESAISYIEKRYDRLLDYAKFHSDKAGIPDEATDLLNEVLLDVLQKDRELLDGLYSIEKGQYRELDFYLLGLIKINAHSLQGPFRWKYRNANIDTGVNVQRLKIVDDLPDDEVDKSEILLKEFRLVNWVFRGLDLNDLEKSVFEWYFINNEPFTEWTGPEKKGKLYKVYNQVINVIQSVLFEYGLTRIKPKTKLTSRDCNLVTQFLSTHKMELRSSRCLKI